jgi:hypothetical protein
MVAAILAVKDALPVTAVMEAVELGVRLGRYVESQRLWLSSSLWSSVSRGSS